MYQKWWKVTCTGNKTSKISKLFKKADKNINISVKTNNRLNNILINKIEHFNIYDSKGIYLLACVNCEKFYIGRTNRKTRFKEHKNDFIYGEGRSNFSTYLIEEDYEIKKNILAVT
jgi:GIY-YIG catalytic domain.